MDRRAEIEQLIINHNRRLQKLKQRQALEGLDVEPKILIEIEDIETTIQELVAELDELEEDSGESIFPLKNDKQLKNVPKKPAEDQKISLSGRGHQAVVVGGTVHGSISQISGSGPNTAEDEKDDKGQADQEASRSAE